MSPAMKRGANPVTSEILASVSSDENGGLLQAPADTSLSGHANIADKSLRSLFGLMLEDELAELRSVIGSGGDARAIDAALEPIASARIPSTIVPLLLMLNDESDDDGMWSLVHAAEQFDDATYIDSFLNALSGVVVGSSRWASILMMRVLNSHTSRQKMVRQVRIASAEAQRATSSVCEGINSRDPRFLAKTTALLVAASNGS